MTTTTANTFKAGTRVTVQFTNSSSQGTVVKTFKNGNVRVDFGNGEVMNINPNDCAIRETKRGRASIINTLTPIEIEEEVTGLLEDLQSADSTDEKKRIRRALRTRGHRGGLGLRAPTVKSIND